MNDDQLRVPCPLCNAINRVPPSRLGESPTCGACKKPLFAGEAITLTAANFDTQTISSDVPLVIDFWAEWCGPCKFMAPVFEKAAHDFSPDIRFGKLDTEREPAIAMRLRIKGIPTLVLYKNGLEAERRTGALDYRELSRWLEGIKT